MPRIGDPIVDANKFLKVILQTNDGVDIGDVDVATVSGVAPQMDSTDRQAVSVYGKASAAGDTELKLSSSGVPYVCIARDTGGTEIITTSSGSDAVGTSEVFLPARAQEYLFDGTNWNRRRANLDATILASAARTTSTNSSDQTNYNGRGVMVTLDVTSITDTPSVVLHIQAKIGSNYEDIFVADAAVTAVGIHSYVVYPAGITAVDDVVEVSQLPLPRTWRVRIVHADTDSITYSVEASVIL